jgi:hypothetical protein
MYIKSIYIDFTNRIMTFIDDGPNSRNKEFPMPSNFDITGPIRLSYVFERNASGFEGGCRYTVGGRLIYA